MNDDEDDNLPVPRDEERIDRLKEHAEALGDQDMKDALIPKEATDIGGEKHDPNPRAEALGYSTGSLAVATNLRGDRTMYIGGDGDFRIECDSGTFIEDITEHN